MNPQSTIALHTGTRMPVLGLGTWQLTRNTADMVTKALEAGYKMIDTSGDYGSQPGIAEALARNPMPREDLFIVAKVEETENAYESVRKNLAELKLDYANLILIHRAPKTGAGEELWDGLRKAKKEGLAKDIGVSNYPTEKIQRLIDAGGEVPVVNQIEWSPFGHSEAMLNYCAQHDIVIQAYSPLTHGKRLDEQTLTEIADKYNKTPTQVMVRWNIQLGTVPIPKPDNQEQIKQNIDVFDFELSADDMATLKGLNEEYSIFDSPLPYI
jgi:2,5-diketo-D-gluconate reductase A